MRLRVALVVAVFAAAAVLPELGVTRVAASNTACDATASGQALTPGVNFGAGEIFASEETEATGVCVSPTGDTFTVTVSAQVEYLADPVNMTWLATDCPGQSLSSPSQPIDGNPSDGTQGNVILPGSCNYLVGDPSLNTLHRLHVVLTTDLVGFTPIVRDSAPWAMGSA